MAPFTSTYKRVDATHQLRITIEQIGQNTKNKTSDVEVKGYMYNDSDYRNWNLDPVVDRQIFGSDHWSPANFSFDLAPHEHMVFIQHVFTVDHNDDGTRTVNFTVKYGDTQIATFDGPQQVGDNLVLDRIGKRPTEPGLVTFSDIHPRSLTAKWAPCQDDNGAKITGYQLRWWFVTSWHGPVETPRYSEANNLSRHITSLTPGATYQFNVRCENHAGWSDWTPDTFALMMPGAGLRVGTKWVSAAAYVRHNGEWQPAVPYIRDGGTWKRAK